MVSEERRGRAMALVTFGLAPGTVAGVPIGILIGEQIGWRWTMGLAVTVGVVSMAALAFRSGEILAIPDGPGSGASVIVKSPQVLLGVCWA